ncbi:MAG: hypothetical protein J6T10_04955 [Methanobrevibacter sp.]|nr:hypothetical protein [Methanobrevibacter sp.]
MEWYQILSLILCIEAFSIIIFIILAANECFYSAFGVCVPMPKDIKNNTKMNWFGCIVCYIGLFILFPIQNICKLVYWLFHV